MKKRGFAVVALIVFLANCVGFSFLSLLEIQNHRISMSKVNEEDESAIMLKISLVDLAENPTLLVWLNKTEIRFNGNRYDVISSSMQNNFLVLNCVNDSKEESLLHKLSENSGGNENNLPGKNRNIQLKKVLDDFVSVQIIRFSKAPSSIFFTNSYQFHSEIVDLSVASPPPWFC